MTAVDRDGKLPGYPKPINEEIPALPSNIDATLSLPELVERICVFKNFKIDCSQTRLVEDARVYYFKVS